MHARSIVGWAVAITLAGPQAASAQAKAYKEVEVKDGGSLSGRVTFVGTPAQVTFPITKDAPVCCAEGQKEKPSPRLVVGKDSGVANTVVFLAEVKEGKPFPAMKPVLDQRQCVFEPHVLLVRKGEKLTMRNSDTVLHNAHAFLRQTDIFNIALANKDQTAEAPMRRDGLINLRCDAGHTWMSSYVFVIPHPYYAVSDAEGKFQLDNIPPGKYVLRVWHEGWKLERKTEPYVFSKDIELDISIEVAAAGTQKIDLELSETGKIAPKK